MEPNPSQDEVVQLVLQIRQAEPAIGIAKLHAKIKSTQPSWALSLNRLRTILRSHPLLSSEPASSAIPADVLPRLYVSQTASSAVPQLELPPSIEVFFSDSRGKGLQVRPDLSPIPEGTVLWTEPALVLIPPLSLVNLIPIGKACSFCARPITASSLVASCATCDARWCSNRCRKLDKLHKHIRHGKYSSEWTAIEKYAVENEWSACYLYAYCLAAATFEELDDPKSSKHLIKNGIEGLAKIRQDIRQRADPEIQRTMFMEDQYDILWQGGYSVVAKFFNHYSPPSYEEFLEGIGMVNVNNLDGSIYLIQSHLNHSCEPNADVKIIGRAAGVKVTAKRQLGPKEELTTTYVDLKADLNTRRQRLLEGWGFWCSCPRCRREEAGILLPEITEKAERLDISGTPTVSEDVAPGTGNRKKKKKGPKKQLVEEPRIRKKSVTFDENVVKIEI